jgi:hypothetical protein
MTAVASRIATTSSAVAAAAFAGEPGTCRGEFLAGTYAALFLIALGAVRRALGAGDIAVYFAIRIRATTLLLATRGFFANTIEGAQFACFIVIATAPCRASAFFRTILSDIARRATLMQHGAEGQHWLRCAETSDLAQFLDGIFAKRLAVAAT